jgi:sugar lactone lactonase YvrE
VFHTGIHPNGLAYSADGRRLFAADTFARQVLAFDVADDGVPVLTRAFSTAGVPGLPDGLATDERGGVWVAFYRGGCLARLDPHAGTFEVIDFPASKPLSLCFGGPDRRELLVVTGRDADRGEPSGGIWRAEAPVPGSPVAPASV